MGTPSCSGSAPRLYSDPEGGGQEPVDSRRCDDGALKTGSTQEFGGQEKGRRSSFEDKVR
jgi:hypothetical protein